MNNGEQHWIDWLSKIPEEQQAILANLLNVKKESEKEDQVTVTRTPTRDLYIENPPPYVDVFGFHALYDRLSFEQNLLLKGPKGDGKTLSVFAYASQKHIPVVVQECSEDTKAFNLMGSQSMIGKKTIFTLGALPTSIDVANEVGLCILLLEEINALTPQVQKQLNALTDFRQMVSMPFIGKSYRLEPSAKLWVVGTMNPSTYGGAYDMNEDLKSRFEELDITYPEHAQEKGILKAVCGSIIDDPLLDLIIRFAKETRQQATGYSLSTRDVVRLVKNISMVGLDTALQMVICKFEGEDRDVVMKRMASVFGQKNIKKYWGA